MSKTHEEFVNEIRVVNPLITIVGKYTKATERIDVVCNTCGYPIASLSNSCAFLLKFITEHRSI